MAKKTALSGDVHAAPQTGSTPFSNELSDLLKKARPLIMGVLNVTPNSFRRRPLSHPAAAIGQAQHLAAEGADILDVGAESSPSVWQCGRGGAR